VSRGDVSAYVKRVRVAQPPPDAPDPMAAPHVQEVVVPAFGGSVRLRSASGGLEALWISLRDEGGRAVIFDDATRAWLPASLRLTPNDARALAALLNRYADTHRETEG